MKVTLISALIGVAVAGIVAAQQGPPQLSPATEELAKRFPYPVIRDLRGVIPRGPRPLPSPPLDSGPWVYSTFEQRDIKVSVVTTGLSHPWSLACLPDGSILITERAGRLRILRNGVLDPTPVAGTPQVLSRGTMAGLMDIALHPDFAQNKWIYISYHKPLAPGVAANSVLRGTWDGKALTDVRDVFVSDDVDTEASRIVFGPNGGDELNVLKPGRNYGWPIVSYGRDYNGPRFPPSAPGFEEPVVFWVPSIAASGLTFYTGERFPAWKRNAFVGGMREGEVAPSGQLQRIVFNDKWEELRREPLLRDLHQRIRDVRQGPDGLLYVLTDEESAALLKIEPVAATPSSF